MAGVVEEIARDMAVVIKEAIKRSEDKLIERIEVLEAKIKALGESE